jgi:hypothetical protein
LKSSLRRVYSLYLACVSWLSILDPHAWVFSNIYF